MRERSGVVIDRERSFVRFEVSRLFVPSPCVSRELLGKPGGQELYGQV